MSERPESAHDDAITAARARTVATPAQARAWLELGRVCGRAGRYGEAFDALVRAMALAPRDEEARRLGVKAARAAGRKDEALALALELQNASPDDTRFVATSLVGKGAFGRAVPWLERLVAAFPNQAEAHHLLGLALYKTARLARAIPELETAVKLDPRHAPAWNNLGNALKAEMRLDDAYRAYEHAIAAQDEKENALRNLLFAMQYDPAVSMAELRRAHERYGARHDRPRAPLSIADPSPERRLRIGYVSADFGSHPVGYFLLPVFANHDHDRVEVFAYAGPRNDDDVTRRLKTGAAHWIATEALSDEALAERIRADRIDVLVDLGGHTRASRLRMFGLRPAPVQVTWAGYVGTTGLSSIDWLIGDERHTPAGYERWTVERIWRMPRTYVCWEPPATPEPGPLPMLARGAPTLACMNNMPKLNPEVLALWAQILADHPSARLRLITKSLGDQALRGRMHAALEAAGVAPERVILSGSVARTELLRIYREEVDLALDPFPYSGGLTTLEALHEGVPVVTLGSGERFASHHSYGHIGAMARPALVSGLVANDPDEYRRLVAHWLSHPAELATLRAELRPTMLRSALCDGPGFTRELEAAFRGMWHDAICKLAGP